MALPDERRPVNIAIGIPHILGAIVLACDFPTVAALSRTSRWVREVVNAGRSNPETRNVHVAIERGTMRYLYHRRVSQYFCPAPRPPRLTWDDNREIELLHTAIDLVGPMTPTFEYSLKNAISNVVRLIGRVDCAYDSEGSEDGFQSSHPYLMPRARCVVVFPYPGPVPPWYNGWVGEDLFDSLFPPKEDVQVLNETTIWVFDRAVYHTEWLWANDFGTSCPRLPPAWHTVILIKADRKKLLRDGVLFERVVGAAALALERRTTVPGAHVTVVTNATLAVDRPIGDPTQSPSLEEPLRSKVKDDLVEGRSSCEFITDALAAIKCISWDQYKASITPRQFELESAK